jgi:hypothetical protein
VIGVPDNLTQGWAIPNCFCEPPVAVPSATWGSIKSLYR